MVAVATTSSASPLPAASSQRHDNVDSFANNHDAILGFDNNDEDEDEEDPIVKRIPVYYTHQHLASLTLLQYPDRPPRPATQHPLLPPSLRPGADPEPDPSHARITARFKPHSQHLELSVPIERDPERWNEDNARDLARGLPGPIAANGDVKGKGKGRQKRVDEAAEQDKRRREEDERDRRRLDRLQFGSLVVPDATNYLVGVVKDDALHLTPVTQTYQLRPQLDYLDQIIVNERRAKREAVRKDDDSEDEVSESDIKAEVARAVQVSVKAAEASGGKGPFGGGGGGGGGGNGRAGASLFEPLRASESEPWLDLVHHHSETPEASALFDHMFVPDEMQLAVLTSLTKPSEYLVA